MESLSTESLEIQTPPPYTLVATTECFQSMMDKLCLANRLAIDMEADSLYHYFEKVCLLQISTDTDTFILDPLVLKEIGSLAPLIADPAVEKVFHAAGYDVFCLRRDYGFAFANIFDTHMAAQLLGYEYLGLSAMMEMLLGIHHSKRRQRDDWSQRPLVAEQLEYAAMDTHHLLQLRDVLESELKQKGRLSWAQEEFAVAAANERPEKEFDAEGYRRIKGNRDLAIQDQVVLRALYLFRDAAARKLDVPPFKVLNNSVLLDLAVRSPQSVQELFKRSGISYRVARKFGTDILNVIAEARQQDPAILELPPRSNGKPPNRAAKHRLEKLKQWRLGKSVELNLPVGVVFPANLLELLAIAPPLDLEGFINFPGMRRWRVQEFGQEILQKLKESEARSES
jgi:ribonuclease D